MKTLFSHRYLTLCTLLCLLMLFTQLASANELKHYCRSNEIVGRITYACSASQFIDTEIPRMRFAQRVLSRIPTKTITKTCKRRARKSCREQLEAQDQKEAEDQNTESFSVRSCVKEETSSCVTDALEVTAGRALNAIAQYTAQCKLSLNAPSSCEQSEARPYCKKKAIERIEENMPPKNNKNLRRLIRSTKRILPKYRKRSRLLSSELEGISTDLTADINHAFGCEVSHGHPACNAMLSTVRAELTYEDFAKKIAEKMREEGFACNADEQFPPVKEPGDDNDLLSNCVPRPSSSASSTTDDDGDGEDGDINYCPPGYTPPEDDTSLVCYATNSTSSSQDNDFCVNCANFYCPEAGHSIGYSVGTQVTCAENCREGSSSQGFGFGDRYSVSCDSGKDIGFSYQATRDSILDRFRGWNACCCGRGPTGQS